MQLATANWFYWVVLGEAPSLTRGTPCTLFCPSALFSDVLLKRCFICPQQECLGLLGAGGAGTPLWMGVWDGPACPGWLVPYPTLGGFPGSLAPIIPPRQLWECRWEQGH